MARYIEAADALRVLSKYYYYKTDAERYDLAIAISNVPTADVAEVKHGQWIFWDKNRVMCSVCKLEPYAGKGAEEFNYCPHCGSRMKGGD